MTNQIQLGNTSSTINPNDDDVSRLEKNDASSDLKRYPDVAKRKKKLDSQLAEKMASEINSQPPALMVLNLKSQLNALIVNDSVEDSSGSGEFNTLSELKSAMAALSTSDSGDSSGPEERSISKRNQTARRGQERLSVLSGADRPDTFLAQSEASSLGFGTGRSDVSPLSAATQKDGVAAPAGLSTALPTDAGKQSRLYAAQQGRLVERRSAEHLQKRTAPDKDAAAKNLAAVDKVDGVKRSTESSTGESDQINETRAVSSFQQKIEKTKEDKTDLDLAQLLHVAVNETSEVLFVPVQASAFSGASSNQTSNKLKAALEKQFAVAGDKKEGVVFKHNFSSWGNGKSVEIVGSASAGYTAVASDKETVDILKRHADDALDIDLKAASDASINVTLEDLKSDEKKDRKW